LKPSGVEEINNNKKGGKGAPQPVVGKDKEDKKGVKGKINNEINKEDEEKKLNEEKSRKHL
jgi:hypothetical protein